MTKIIRIVLAVQFCLLFLYSCSTQQNPKVLICTDLGDIIVELYNQKAPVTANHFLQYVKEGKLDSAYFYRAVRPDNQTNPIKIEVLQGGLEVSAKKDTLNPIPHENTLQTRIIHENGVISMARAAPGTANSEFFICIGNQPSLDLGGNRNPDGQGFAAFGKVIRGMEVVKSIQKLPTSGEWQFLKKPILIKNVVFLAD
jgi:peptidyl-prolyl cis-trans isomerase A (cyclophilin A)